MLDSLAKEEIRRMLCVDIGPGDRIYHEYEGRWSTVASKPYGSKMLAHGMMDWNGHICIIYADDRASTLPIFRLGWTHWWLPKERIGTVNLPLSDGPWLYA